MKAGRGRTAAVAAVGPPSDLLVAPEGCRRWGGGGGFVVVAVAAVKLGTGGGAGRVAVVVDIEVVAAEEDEA